MRMCSPFPPGDLRLRSGTQQGLLAHLGVRSLSGEGGDRDRGAKRAGL